MKPFKKEYVKSIFNYRCGYCGFYAKDTMTVDHIVAKSSKNSKNSLSKDTHAHFLGNPINRISNLMPCCNFCNLVKRDMRLQKFRECLSSSHRWAIFWKTNLNFRIAARYGGFSDKPFFFFERQENVQKKLYKDTNYELLLVSFGPKDKDYLELIQC